MKLIRIIGMHTDYEYGQPIETSRVELWMDTDVITPEILKIAKGLQEEQLHSMAKRMPPRYWIKRGEAES